MTCAALEVGTDATRLVVPGPDGRAEPVAVLPAGTTADTALDELVGQAADVALVHPPGWAPERVAAAAAGLAGRRVHTVPSPVAVLAGETGGRLVVDAGRSGTTLTVVVGGCVRSTEWVPIGGDRLDAVLAGATGCPPDRVRAAREALSFRDGVDVPGFGRIDARRAEEVLRPEFDDVVARVPAVVAGVGEIVVTGGLARTPLLAALLDDRAGCPVRVLPEPDLAAVRGALAWSGEPRAVDDVVDATGWPTATERTGSEGTATSGSSASGCGRPDDATRPRRSRLLPAAAVLGALLAGTGAVLGATPPAPAPPAGTLVQYGYATALPAGWEHTGGDPERRRTLLTRTGSPDGVELVSVERSPLGYDGRPSRTGRTPGWPTPTGVRPGPRRCATCVRTPWPGGR